MKTKSFLITALIVVSAGMYAVAGDEPGNTGFAVLPVKGSEIFKIIYKGEISEKVKLSLYDANNTLIFTESISGTGFIRPLNFKELAAGEYTIELVSATGKKVEKISHQRKISSSYIHVNKLKNDGDKFLLSVTGNAENEKINVRIYDTFNNLIYNEVNKVSGSFAQVYNVKNFGKSVTFEISDSTGKTKIVTF